MKIEFYSVRKPVKGVCKQHAIWGRTGCTAFPLIYLQRPKNTSDELWELLMQSIRLDLFHKDLDKIDKET